MRTILLCYISLFTASFLLANDGAFYASGANIYPTKESSVQMKKEVLTITRKGDWVHVDVKFDFFNPESSAKQVLTAFVSPMQGGDVDYKAMYIKDFTVVMNDSTLQYNLKKHYNDSSEIGTESQSGEYRFYFNAVFKPGTNTIHHSYNVRASGSVEVPNELDYTLVTARSWAKGSIEDFELNIVSTEPEAIGINNSLYNNAPWTFSGKAKPYAKPLSLDYEGKNLYKAFFVQQGALQLRLRNFRPKKDLHIVWFPPTQLTGMSGNVFPELWTLRQKMYDNPSAEDLRILRNAAYAKYGYMFKDKKLQDFFSKCFWYMPDSNVNATIEKLLTKEDREYIQQIAEEEKKLLSGNQQGK